MQKALIYCRVSTEEQAEEGRYSLQAQERLCRKSAEDLGYRVIGIFKDPGKSATTMNRPGLQDLIIQCQKDKSINAIFVQDTDRLARNTKDHLTIKAILEKCGTKIISVSQPIIDNSPEGNMIDTIIAAVNQFQSEITARKTLKGIQEKIKEGWAPGVAPLGYKNTVNKDEKRIIAIDPSVAPFIKEAFKLYSTGNYSIMELDDLLYKKGLRARRGEKLHPSRLQELLTNRFYIGEIKWGEFTNKKGMHPVFINKSVFNQVQDVLAGHRFYASRRRIYDFLLRGFIYCASCGRRFTAEHHQKKNKSYYHCQKKDGYHRPNGCQEPYIEVDYLEKLVEEKFKEIQFSPEFINTIISRVKTIFDKRKEEINHEKEVLFNQKSALEHKRDVVEEKLLAGVISDDDFSRIRVKINQELENIQDRLDELERQRGIRVDEIQEILRFTRNIYQTYKRANYILKRHYLGFFWERFEVHNKAIVNAVPTKLFQLLLNENKVRIRSVLGPERRVDITNLLRILQDRNYVEALIERMKIIKEIEKSLKFRPALAA